MRDRVAETLKQSQILNVLSSLVERSIVVLDNSSGRYRLLESVKHFAYEQLLSLGEESISRGKHLDYLLDLSAEAAKYWGSPKQQYWFSRVVSENDNIQTVLDFAHQSDRGKDAGLLVARLLTIWSVCDMNYIADERALEVQSLTDLSDFPSEQSAILAHLAWASIRRGNFDEARAIQMQAVEVAESSNDLRLLACQQRSMGHACHAAGDVDGALFWYGRAKQTLEIAPDDAEFAALLNDLGIVAVIQRRLDDAIAAYRESADLHRQGRRYIAMLSPTTNLAKVYITLGRVQEAAQVTLSALDVVKAASLDRWADLGDVAALVSIQDHPHDAVMLISAIAVDRDRKIHPMLDFGHPGDDVEGNKLRVLLGDVEYQRLCVEGAQLTREEVLSVVERQLRIAAGSDT